jgi:hypothetical protein
MVECIWMPSVSSRAPTGVRFQYSFELYNEERVTIFALRSWTDAPPEAAHSYFLIQLFTLVLSPHSGSDLHEGSRMHWIAVG